MWKIARTSHPNWAILPEDRRSVVWPYTEHWTPLVEHVTELGKTIDIEFLFEFNWRLERCLCPIFGNLISSYEKVLDRYSPFHNALTSEEGQVTHNAGETEVNWEEITPKWFELHLSILRFYREEGLLDS